MRPELTRRAVAQIAATLVTLVRERMMAPLRSVLDVTHHPHKFLVYPGSLGVAGNRRLLHLVESAGELRRQGELVAVLGHQSSPFGEALSRFSALIRSQISRVTGCCDICSSRLNGIDFSRGLCTAGSRLAVKVGDTFHSMCARTSSRYNSCGTSTASGTPARPTATTSRSDPARMRSTRSGTAASHCSRDIT